MTEHNLIFSITSLNFRGSEVLQRFFFQGTLIL